jgi:hypothetical protein
VADALALARSKLMRQCTQAVAEVAVHRRVVAVAVEQPAEGAQVVAEPLAAAPRSPPSPPRSRRALRDVGRGAEAGLAEEADLGLLLGLGEELLVTAPPPSLRADAPSARSRASASSSAPAAELDEQPAVALRQHRELAGVQPLGLHVRDQGASSPSTRPARAPARVGRGRRRRRRREAEHDSHLLRRARHQSQRRARGR